MSQKTEAFQEALLEAQGLAALVAEQYRPAAFQAALSMLVAEGGVESIALPKSRPKATPDASGLPEHIGEVLAQLSGKTHQDLFEAIVFHALRVRSVDGLTRDEILEAYSVARVPKPANASDVIAKCLRRGHLMPGTDKDSKATLRMTVTGEQYMLKVLAVAKSTDQ